MAVAVPAPDPAADRAALLYERHHQAILAYCSWRLRTRFDAEEAAQTTFTRALSALRRGHRPRNERAWLVTIARNVCTTLGTAPHRALEVTGDVPHRLSQEVDDGLGPELEAALASLPEGQRRALLLREWHELSYREIAAELGVSVGTVESWIFRARRSLASALGSARRHLGLAGLLRSLGPGTGAKVAATAALATAVVATERAVVPERSDSPQLRPARERVAPSATGSGTRPHATVVPEGKRRVVMNPRSRAPRAVEADLPTESPRVTPTRDASTAAGKPSAPAADSGPAAQPGSTSPAPPAEQPPVPAVKAPTLPTVDPPALPPVEPPALPPVETPPLPVAAPELPPVPTVTVPAPVVDVPVAVPKLP